MPLKYLCVIKLFLPNKMPVYVIHIRVSIVSFDRGAIEISGLAEFFFSLE